MKMNLIEKTLVNSSWSRKRVRALAGKLLRYVDSDSRLDFLEVGCGSGEVARYIAERYRSDVVGIDVDPEQVEMARKSADGLSNVRFLEADATSLPFADGSFDVVLSFGVLHHIPNWLDALEEIRRVLRDGGYFLYADVIYPERVTRMDSLSRAGFGLVTISLDELNSFTTKSGFETTYSSLTRAFICRNFEAVYRRR